RGMGADVRRQGSVRARAGGSQPCDCRRAARTHRRRRCEPRDAQRRRIESGARSRDAGINRAEPDHDRPAAQEMSRALEVFWVPLLFLPVPLPGGVPTADRVAFVRPPLSALVLAVLLLAALVRSGALAPQRLMHPSRSALQNSSGAAVILTMFAATVQA